MAECPEKKQSAPQLLLLEQAAHRGYYAIGLRCPNRWTINDLCGPTGGPGCFGALRLEILDGEERSPLLAYLAHNLP